MEAAQAAAQSIFEMAARQRPPWACEIVEREIRPATPSSGEEEDSDAEEAEGYARVAVKATLGGKVLTIVAQVGQLRGGLKFFRRQGLVELEDIDTHMYPYDAESLEEDWADG